MTSDDRRDSAAFAVTITLAMAISTFMQYALGALGPFIREDLELSHGALGSLTTMLFVSGALLSPVAGPLVDRFGGRRTLALLFTAGMIGAIGASLAHAYAGLLAAIAVAGVANALGNPSTNKLLSLHVAAHRQGIMTGLKQSGVQLGAFAAGAVLPPVAEAAGWRRAMALSALAAAAGLAMTRLTVPAAVPGAKQDPVTAAGARRRVPLGRDINRLAWYAGLMGAGVGAVSAFLPIYSVEELGLSRTAAGLVASVMGGVGVIARLVLGRRSDRSDAPVTVALGWLAVGAVGAVGVLSSAGTVGRWLLWPGAVAFGATAIAWNAIGMLSIVRGVDGRLAGRASGRVLFGFFAGLLVGPLSFGWSIDWTRGYSAGWAGVAGVFAAAAAVAVRWHGGRVPQAPAHDPR